MKQLNELRIGNWVNYGDANRPYKIDLGDFVEIGMKEIDPSYFKPIPLTPEILEKAGFVKTDQNEFQYAQIVINLLDDNRIQFCNPTNYGGRVNCQYLHQLQNLYFTLTGEELQIEL